MKKLAAAFLLLALLSFVQAVDAQTAVRFYSGTIAQRNSTCRAGDVFYGTDTVLLYICTANNTWGTGISPSPSAGAGTVTSVSVTTANGVSGSVATATTTPAITLTLGAITPTTVNGNTFTTGTYTLTGTAGKTLNFTNSLTLSGTDATTMTFPTTSATIARTDAANTFTGTQTFGAVVATGITGLTGVTTPNAAGGTTLGSAALPFSSAFIGGAATNNFQLTGTATAARVVTFPDVASYTVAQITNAQTFAGTQTFSGTIAGAAITASGTITQTSASATAFSSGPNGTTNPVFQLVNSTASQADGISITGLAAGSGTNITALSSGSNSPINLVPKGTGSVVHPNGLVGTPGITFANGATTGIYSTSSSSLDYSISGTRTFAMQANIFFIISDTGLIKFGTGFDGGLARSAAGVIETNNGTVGGLGKLLTGVVVTAKTSNYSVVTADKGTYFTNVGAGAEVDFTLPTAVAGLRYTFIVEAAQTLKIIAGASTTIRIAGSVSASAGNITNATIGGTITLIATSATTWVALAPSGTWTVN